MRKIVAAVAVLILVAATALPAFAGTGGQPNGNAGFGECVSEHAKNGEFSGTHNPGMHNGKSGWPGGQ